MSTSSFVAFGLLTFIVFLSSSTSYRPVSSISLPEPSNIHDDLYGNDEEKILPIMVRPKESSYNHVPRSALGYLRPSRNSWFRVSSYQHMKPTSSDSEEKASGDNLLRWGWSEWWLTMSEVLLSFLFNKSKWHSDCRRVKIADRWYAERKRKGKKLFLMISFPIYKPLISAICIDFLFSTDIAWSPPTSTRCGEVFMSRD